MRHLFVPVLVLSSVLCAQGKEQPKEPAKGAPAAAKIDFEKQILPILEKSCVECHSTGKLPDGKPKKAKGGVNLEGKEQMLASKKGKLVVAKKSDESVLYEAISKPADDKDRMPPAKKGDPLPKDQIELIKKWIDDGADFGKWTGKKAEAGAGGGEGGDRGHEGGDKPKGKEPPKPGGEKKNGG